MSGESYEPHGRVFAVIDDDEAVCDSIRFLLEIDEFAVHTYLSGTAFLKDYPAVECLIVDYRMPGLNGLEFASELKARGSKVPIIMITASADARLERRAAEVGIKRVLHKPPPIQELLRAVREELE
jgi:two-component system, LuxR family, response regulator FixJ